MIWAASLRESDCCFELCKKTKSMTKKKAAWHAFEGEEGVACSKMGKKNLALMLVAAALDHLGDSPIFHEWVDHLAAEAV